MPEPRPKRRLTILDAMVLVAATAPAFLLAKGYLRCNSTLSYVETAEHSLPSSPAIIYAHVGMLVLSLTSVALLPLRFCPPRPRLRRLFRLPGTTPGMISALALALTCVKYLLDGRHRWSTHFGTIGVLRPEEWFALRLIGLRDEIALGVFCVWLTLRIGRKWRTEPTWIDRAGRLCGVLWITLGAFVWGFRLVYGR